MRAVFGCLQNAELVFHDGLNLLELPNESGKSTWCAFLLAMFYGIDSSERARGEQLPVKTRYLPWSGAPMQGLVELEWQGRTITIERSSDRRGSLNLFRAFYSDSGAAVPELTADNCGQILLGAEKSVFERSAFIRQAGLNIGADPALEARLHAMVTTGEESVSLSGAQEVLKNRRNQLGRNHTGKLSKVTEELEQIRRSLEEIRAIEQEDFALNEELTLLKDRQAELEKARMQADLQDRLRKKQQLDAARAAAESATEQANRAIQAAQGLPEEAVLASLIQESYELPARPLPPEKSVPERPVPPAALKGLTGEALEKRIQEDLQDFDSPDQIPAPNWKKVIIASILAVPGIAFAAVGYLLHMLFLIPAVALLAAALLIARSGLKQHRELDDLEQEAFERRTAVQALYETTSRDEIVRLGERYQSALRNLAEQENAVQERQKAYEKELSYWNAQTQGYLDRVRRLTRAQNAEAAREDLRRSLTLRKAADQAKREAIQLRQNYAALKAAVGSVDIPADAVIDPKPVDLAATQSEQARLQNRCAGIENLLSQHRGQIAALGDPDVLSAKMEELEETADTIRLHIAALDTALAALNSAGEEVQRRISPALSRRAGELLARLTQERYDQVQMDADFRLSARLSGDAMEHQISYLSAGAADQLYLALRLAICEMALGSEVPFVLDDALVTFDETRCLRTLELLKSLAENRQILLFTCQAREGQLLRKLESSAQVGN